MDSIFAALIHGSTPGVAVLVRKDGRTVFQRGYGLRELRNEAKIDSRTNFRLASFTKQFTARAIMLLVQDRKLRYEQPVVEILPGLPAGVTIRHLLNHTSGLPDYEDLMPKGKWTAEHQITDSEVLELLKGKEPKFPPGSKWEYSNSGYVVLGRVVAKVSGKDFGAFLNDRIFRPLKMRNTQVYGSGVIPNRAYGHILRDGKFVESDQSSTSGTLGDGGIYSNLEDLAKWDAALSRWDMREAWTPAEGTNYGFGWFIGDKTVWHTGLTMGFRTIIQRWPEERLTVIILANRTDVDTARLASETATSLRGSSSRPASSVH